MELREYVYLFWRWLWLIILGAVIAAAGAYLVSRNRTPLYRATAIILVSEGKADSNEYRSILVGQQLAQSYTKRLTNYEVLEQAVKNLNLDINPGSLKGQMQINLLDETQLIALSVTHANPRIAKDLANEIPTVFAERNVNQQLERYSVSKTSLEVELAKLEEELAEAELTFGNESDKLLPNQTAIDQANNIVLQLRDTHSRLLQSYENVRLAEAGGLNTIHIDEYAREPKSPIGPNVMNNTMLAAAIGALLATGVAFLIEYLDDTVKTPMLIERGTGLATLGNIEQMTFTNSSDALVVTMDPRSPAAEAFRHIRTNIQFISVDRKLKSMVITSANMGEGKSTISSNLAIALAQSGKKVILVDADMRRPSLHTLFEVNGGKGLAELIIRGREDPSFLRGTLVPNLRILPVGKLPPNPAELLGSERMRVVHAWLETQADYVVYDSPPLLAVTDGAVLSQLADTTLLVVSAQTRYPAFVTAIKQVASLDSDIAGVIMNKVNMRHKHSYYYYYYQPRYYQSQAPNNGRKTLKQRLQALNSFNIFH